MFSNSLPGNFYQTRNVSVYNGYNPLKTKRIQMFLIKTNKIKPIHYYNTY